MLELIDTHCHIQSIGASSGEANTLKLWQKDLDLTANGVVESARQDGVNKLICVGCDYEDSQLAINFVKSYPGCYASIGIHPHEAIAYQAGSPDLAKFAALVHEAKVIAIGECGLDYYYEHSPKSDQIAVLKYQIELALASNLPLIFHVREAFEEFWPIFDSYSGVRGVLHSFTDTSENLEAALKRGLLIGVNGIATFSKNSEQLEVYKAIPLDRLLLETDAPYLTPQPHRSQINQPKMVKVIAQFLAGLRHEDVELIAEATTANALRLFSL